MKIIPNCVFTLLLPSEVLPLASPFVMVRAFETEAVLVHSYDLSFFFFLAQRVPYNPRLPLRQLPYLYARFTKGKKNCRPLLGCLTFNLFPVLCVHIEPVCSI